MQQYNKFLLSLRVDNMHALLKFIQSSYKVLTKFLQSSYKVLTKLLQSSYKVLTKFLNSSFIVLRTPLEVLMKFEKDHKNIDHMMPKEFLKNFLIIFAKSEPVL